MPSWNVTLTILLLASIGVLTWVMIRSQRQYLSAEDTKGKQPASRAQPFHRGVGVARPPAPATAVARALTNASAGSGSDGPTSDALAARLAARARANADPGSLTMPGGLPHIVASAIEGTSRVKARNSTEGRVVETLRTALNLALAGQFDAEVRAVIEGTDGIQSWHDIRKLNNGGVIVAHLAVGPGGVFVIDAVTRSAKLSYDEQRVYVGRGPSRSVDPMLEELAARVAAVAPLVEPAVVHGIIVLEDRLSLPAEVRSPGLTVGGVPLITSAQLPHQLSVGLVRADAVDVDVEAIWARLFAAFEPAIDSPDHPFAITVPDTVPSTIFLPR
jgi:hypothetical protein